MLLCRRGERRLTPAPVESMSADETSTAVEAPSPAGEGAGDGEVELLAPGNPLRWVRGGAVLVVGALVAFVVMAMSRQFRWGVPLGALGILVASAGALDLLGSFDDPDARVARRTTLGELAGP